MSRIRRATPADAEELIRLRKVMLDSYGSPDPDGRWISVAIADLRRRLAPVDADLAAFVAERAESGALAACAVGSVERRLGSPGNPGGTNGHLFSVATDPDMRRRGLSRGCVEALLDWFRERGLTRVELRASPEAEPLYASLGFVRTPDPAMRLTL
ncbi:GNAT family N-acetyltransferase [Streptomyces sp. NPDC059076]|uniref:GNAT family N-acetyltransferase n=1 Tax=unclassified Streptomyces TaxID=2593676 RepID=UPI00369C69DF